MNTRPHRKQPTIMIADHDEDERGLLRAILKLIGCRVIEASDAPQAIDLIRRQAPDVLLLDLTLPRLGGRVGLKRIRTQLAIPNLPIVAVSPVGAIRQAGSSSTVFLRRPIEYRQLCTLIDRFLPGQLPDFARSKHVPR